MSDAARGGLLSQLQGFNKDGLKKTETRVKTEDGKILRESCDSSGNYKSVVENAQEYGFVPDIRRDLQVGEVMDNLIFGSQDVAAEWDILEKYRVTHILNIGSYVQNYFPKEVTYMNLKVMDTPETKVLPYFDKAFKFIDSGRESGCVFVHCNAGVSRAATFIIGYLMKTNRQTFDEVFTYVKSKRPAICPNIGFQIQLKEFEQMLNLSGD